MLSRITPYGNGLFKEQFAKRQIRVPRSSVTLIGSLSHFPLLLKISRVSENLIGYRRAVGSNNFVAADLNPPMKVQMVMSAVGTEHMIDSVVLP